jgi:hypothetical protein
MIEQGVTHSTLNAAVALCTRTVHGAVALCTLISALQTPHIRKDFVALLRVVARVVDEATNCLANVRQVVRGLHVFEKFDHCRIELNRTGTKILHGILSLIDVCIMQDA